MRGRKVLGLCVALLFAVALLTTRVSWAVNLNVSDFERAYSLSFQLDACGEPLVGAEWRSALLALTKECGAPVAAQRYAAVADRVNRKMKALAASGSLKTEPRICRQLQGSQSAILRHALAAYAEHKLSAADALRLNCDGTDRK